jgi:hypothetical protein
MRRPLLTAGLAGAAALALALKLLCRKLSGRLRRDNAHCVARFTGCALKQQESQACPIAHASYRCKQLVGGLRRDGCHNRRQCHPHPHLSLIEGLQSEFPVAELLCTCSAVPASLAPVCYVTRPQQLEDLAHELMQARRSHCARSHFPRRSAAPPPRRQCAQPAACNRRPGHSVDRPPGAAGGSVCAGHRAPRAAQLPGRDVPAADIHRCARPPRRPQPAPHELKRRRPGRPGRAQAPGTTWWTCWRWATRRCSCCASRWPARPWSRCCTAAPTTCSGCSATLACG